MSQMEVKEQLLIRLKEKSIDKARRDLLSFTLYTNPKYKVNWHHKLTCKYINAWIKGDIKRLMIFEPPGHGKSELTSRRLPAYLHGIDPDADIMAVSYSDSLASDMTVDVQRIMDSPSYQEVFPNVRITAPETRNPIFVRNSEEHHIIGRIGKYRGQGVGGAFTGKRAKYIIIDDPIKGRQEADSIVFRERLWGFYTNDLRSRLQAGGGSVLLTETRWHEDDLAGRLLELAKKDPNADQWKVLVLPAIREDLDNPEDPRQLGDVLWPEAFPLTELLSMRAGDLRGFESLYQQSPTHATGEMFKEEMFDQTELPTQFDYKFITADTAYNDKKENDFTVFAAWGVSKGELFLIDVWRKQIKASDIEEPAAAFIKGFSEYGFRGAYIEPKGHGIYLNQILPRRGIIMPSESQVKEFYSDRRLDKVERANNAIPYLSNRKVHFNKNMANKETLLAETLKFPRAKHDDFVDCLIDGIKFVFASKVSILDVL